MAEAFTHLAGLIKTDAGQISLSRGDSVPEGADKDELARLRANGSFADVDEAKETVDTSALAEASDEEIAEFVSKSSAKEVVDAAGEDVELAQRLLDAEQDGKDRKTAVEPLEAIIDGDDN